MTWYWEWLKFRYLCLWAPPHSSPNFPRKMQSCSTQPFFKKQKYSVSVSNISSKHMTSLDLRYTENRWKVNLGTHSVLLLKVMCYYSSRIHSPRKKEYVALRLPIPRLKTWICYFWKKVAFIFLPELFGKFAWQERQSCYRTCMHHQFRTLTELSIVSLLNEKLTCRFSKELI